MRAPNKSVFAYRYWWFTNADENLFKLTKDEWDWFRLLCDEALK